MGFGYAKSIELDALKNTIHDVELILLILYIFYAYHIQYNTNSTANLTSCVLAQMWVQVQNSETH